MSLPSAARRARLRLRLGLLLFVLALLAPGLLLVRQTYAQLQWAAVRPQQTAAEALTARIDAQLARLAATEDQRPIADYEFLDPTAGADLAAAGRSPLAAWPPRSDDTAIPGVLGWFQVVADGTFGTPLLPPPGRDPGQWGMRPADLAARRAQAARIETVLRENRLVARDARSDQTATPESALDADELTRPTVAPALGEAASRRARSLAPAPAPQSQAAFDSLSAAAPGREQAKAEIEQRAGPEEPPARAPLRLFAQTIEPCEIGLLDSGHLVLFRRAWRDGERLIQGALIEAEPFLRALIGAPFSDSALGATSQLRVVYRDVTLAVFADPNAPRTAAAGDGIPLHRARLREPFGGLELRFAAWQLPTPPGVALIGWMAAALALVLAGGIGFMYRLGMRQLALVRQQQEFIAAVSHELKTPLTSIRMYADMLTAGFASAERVPVYYRFIRDESERLSRLIANILQLARIERAALTLHPQPVVLAELLEQVRARAAAQIERAGFRLELRCPEELQVQADVDAFLQILLNIIDNALKFAADAPDRTLVIVGEPAPDQRTIVVRVRDFGPGVPRGQRQRIFRLFERGAQARRQAIAGTGIGLALVKALTEAMGGRVTAMPCDPGAEFRIELPGAETGPR